MRLPGGVKWRWFAAALLVAIETAAAAMVLLAVSPPADAQFWGGWDDRYSARPRRGVPQQRYQQDQFNFFGNWGTEPRMHREPPRAPVDFSRAPAPRKSDATPSVKVLVLGDSMADWLAYGLEDAFSDKPEIGIVRKHQTNSGLINYEARGDKQWAQVARDVLTAEKPAIVIMMVGLHDRQAIRERPPARPQPNPAGQPTDIKPQGAQGTEAKPQESAEKKPEPEKPAATAAEPAKPVVTGPFEFRTDRWAAAYVRRIDTTITALKASGARVYWVGLPSLRNARATTDVIYLNDLYRTEAEKAGVTYVDVWDGFVDEGGRFTYFGPDFEGQNRRLRAGDGIHFTKPGARKLAHFVEREIQRFLQNRLLPVALPTPEEPLQQAPAARPGGPAPRPMVGPVIPLTTPTAGSEELLGGRTARPAPSDPAATNVFVKGEPVSAPAGRADNFAWPRGKPKQQPVAGEETVPQPAAAAVEPPAAPATAAQPSPAAAALPRTAANPNPPPQAPKRALRPVRRNSADNGAPRPPLSISPSQQPGFFFR